LITTPKPYIPKKGFGRYALEQLQESSKNESLMDSPKKLYVVKHRKPHTKTTIRDFPFAF
jgi:hypothetical protein